MEFVASNNSLVLDNTTLRKAVDRYFKDPVFAIEHPINNWNVSAVTDMSGLFSFMDEFNESIEDWDVSNVTNMQGMFDNAEEFDQPLAKWNVSKVTNMREMFQWATNFNQPLNNWNVSNVRNMKEMFKDAINFNQPLDRWNVSNVTNMDKMFYGATSFNKPLNMWNINHDVIDMEENEMFTETPMKIINYPWGDNIQPIQLPEPIHIRKIHKTLDIMSNKYVIKKWKGTRFIEYLFYLYLLNKYKSQCVFRYSNSMHYGLQLKFNDTGCLPNYAHMKFIVGQLIDCIKRGLDSIIIPLNIRFISSSSSHANLLIYRKKENVIEHFEPHGSIYQHNLTLYKPIRFELHKFIRLLNSKLQENQLNPVRFISSNIVCPRMKGF